MWFIKIKLNTLQRMYKTYVKVEHATWQTTSGQIPQPSGGTYTPLKFETLWKGLEYEALKQDTSVPISSPTPTSPGIWWVDSASPLPFLSGNKMDTLGWQWGPYLVTSLISRVCRSKFLRGSKLSQIRFWLALTATPLQRQREHSTSRTCNGIHPPKPQNHQEGTGGRTWLPRRRKEAGLLCDDEAK